MLNLFSHFFILTTFGYSVIHGVHENSASTTGYFWQLTDFHLDLNYSTSGDPKSMCHKSVGKSEAELNKFGDYRCDAPLDLVRSAINSLPLLTTKSVDFILWTGDSVPHVPDNTLDSKKVYDNIGNITSLLAEAFPSVPIFPMLGNHDAYPSNQFPSDWVQFYGSYLSEGKFNLLLRDEDTQALFTRGGYYNFSLNPRLQLAALNTNLYYSSDKRINANDLDPGGQFAYLRDFFKWVRSTYKKVLLASHIAPGYFERVANIRWFEERFNRLYVELLRDNYDLIVGQIYGHEHTDAMRVMSDHVGVWGCALLAPAVTPWNSTLAGAGYNNPGVRLYSYDTSTGELLGYTQYYTDLSSKHNPPVWLEEYNTWDQYGLSSLSCDNLYDLLLSFPDSDFFPKYLRYNGVSVPQKPCDGNCQTGHVCASLYVNTSDYQWCMKVGLTSSPWAETSTSPPGRETTSAPPGQSTSTRLQHERTSHEHHPRRHIKRIEQRARLYLVLLVMMSVLAAIAVLIACCCRRARHPSLGRCRRVPVYATLGNSDYGVQK